MMEYFHGIVLPKMVKDKYNIEKDSEMYNCKKKVILLENGLKTLCPITVYRYMVRLGFKYKTRQKGFYVDGHERPATILYRNKFILRYFKYKRRMFRWI